MQNFQSLCAIVCVSFALRAYFGVAYFGTLHNDEYLKTLDQEHYLRTGEGWCTFEFREHGLGMQMPDGRVTTSYTASNSHLWPLLFYGLRSSLELLGVDSVVMFYTAHKLFVALVTSTLPAAVFLYARTHRPDSPTGAFLVAVWVAIDDWLVQQGSHALVNGFVSPFVFISLWALSRVKSFVPVCLAGFVAAIMTYIRPDCALIIGLHGLLFLDVHRWKHYIVYVVGALFGIALGGAVDFRFYGVWFCSPVNWFTFNILEGHAGTTFGTEPWDFYWKAIVARRPLVLTACILACVTFVVQLLEAIGKLFTSTTAPKGVTPRADMLRCARPGCVVNIGMGNLRLWIMVMVCWYIYAQQSHKEERFAHQAVVLLVILLGLSAADAISFLVKLVHRDTSSQQYVKLRSALLVTVCVMVVAKSFGQYRSREWDKSDGFHRALIDVDADPNARGLIVTAGDLNEWMGFIRRKIPIENLGSPPLDSNKFVSLLGNKQFTHAVLYKRLMEPNLFKSLEQIGFKQKDMDLRGDVTYFVRNER